MEMNQFDIQWHVWTIKPVKLETLLSKIKAKAPEVGEILYPTVAKAIEGKPKASRRVPLYSTYVFIQYEHTAELWHRLKEIKHLVRYIGPCSAKDLISVESLKRLETINNVPMEKKMFYAGQKIRANSGPFAGVEGEVVSISSNCIQTTINVFGRKVRATFSRGDLDIISI
jgi:transcription antitermination factor NusG